MSRLEPKALFERIARDVPGGLHLHLFVTGSLAAAYHFEAQLEGRAVNTKDADLVIHPAGDTVSCQKMAEQLFTAGWVRTEECYPQQDPEPAGSLRAIRLYPPESKNYFIELLNLPQTGQTEMKSWIPVHLADGWFGLPCFRFLALAAQSRLPSHIGLEYAHPAMMALSNLLAHPIIGNERMQSAGPIKGLLRSAKDLGRVIALARLAGRDQTEEWLPMWHEGLKVCFPDSWKELSTNAGNGLRELHNNGPALEEARMTVDIGLLSGKGITLDMIRASAERLFQDVIEPLARLAER